MKRCLEALAAARRVWFYGLVDLDGVSEIISILLKRVDASGTGEEWEQSLQLVEKASECIVRLVSRMEKALKSLGSPSCRIIYTAGDDIFFVIEEGEGKAGQAADAVLEVLGRALRESKRDVSLLASQLRGASGRVGLGASIALVRSVAYINYALGAAKLLDHYAEQARRHGLLGTACRREDVDVDEGVVVRLKLCRIAGREDLVRVWSFLYAVESVLVKRVAKHLRWRIYSPAEPPYSMYNTATER